MDGFIKKKGKLGGAPLPATLGLRRLGCTLGRGARIVHFFYRSSSGVKVNQRLLSVGTSENTNKTMPYSRRDAQD